MGYSCQSFLKSIFKLVITVMLLSILPAFESRSHSHAHYSQCFKLVLNVTQSCDNTKLLYVPLMGGGSGLGSEFNHYFVQSTLQAIMEGRRMVYLRIPSRKWEYDCDEKLGWGCYLRFRCDTPTGVEPKDFDFSDRDSAFQDNSRKVTYNRNGMNQFSNTVKELFAHYKRIGKIDKDKVCDIEANNITPTIATSLVARFLYKLQPTVIAEINKVKTQYQNLIESGYFSLQLRLTDKTAEMSQKAWNWMTNATQIAYFMKPYFDASPNVKKLFTGK